ncbi:hypothetical protein V2J09_013867 [Rumex salicifolius]
MGSQVAEAPRKLRMLCLHGLRTSGAILKFQLSKWPKEVHDLVDFVCIDAPFPAKGKSDVEGIFDPPYFEWVHFNDEHTEYTNFEEMLKYIEDRCIENGPIDGILGFSQGGIIASALPGLQAQGLCLTKIPKIKFVIIIAGGKLRSESWKAKAYEHPLAIPNLHFLGEKDFMRPYGMQLLKSCIDPVIIHHSKNHIVPRVVPDILPTVLKFLENVNKIVFKSEEIVEAKTEETMKAEAVVEAKVEKEAAVEAKPAKEAIAIKA